MDQILSSFMSLPTMAVGAIFAGIGGGLGALIANFAVKNLKSKKLALVAQGGLMIGTMAVFSILGGHLQHSFAAEKAIADLKKHRLFSILFDLHPDSESEMKNKLRTIISSTPRTSRFQESQQASAQIVAKYFQKHLPTASADDTHRLLLRNVAVMRKFENRPSLCVGYYMGNPQFSPTDMTAEFISEETNLKADIIENAAKFPTMLPYTSSYQDLLQLIARAYRENGYNVNDIPKIARVGKLPASEGCRVGIEFIHAIASLGPVQATFIFKNLIAMSVQQ